MPVCVDKVQEKYRVVECTTRKIAKNSSGTAVDGGGHSSRQAAIRQAQAINIQEREKG